MTDIDSAMESFKIGLSLFSEAIGLAKKTQELLPESKDKEAVEKSLNEANKAAKLAEAQIAQALGYNLCKCTFPPQVMLSNGYKETNYAHVEEFICPLCKKSSIPPKAPPLPKF
jgi:hypothetical protein